MRIHPIRAALVLFCSCTVPLVAQASAQKPPKKGDAVIVRGCLRGSAVEQADLLTEDTEGDPKQNDQVPPLTYRLQVWRKSVLKELKDKRDTQGRRGEGHPEVRAVSGIGTDVGRTRITIGADPRNPTRGAEAPMRVLEAMSFEGSTVSCGESPNGPYACLPPSRSSAFTRSFRLHA